MSVADRRPHFDHAILFHAGFLVPPTPHRPRDASTAVVEARRRNGWSKAGSAGRRQAIRSEAIMVGRMRLCEMVAIGFARVGW
jgi:hypothetical protein